MNLKIWEIIVSRSNLLILSVILLIASILMFNDLSEPWIGHVEQESARIANIARNYLKYGYLTTKLGAVQNYNTVKPPDFEYYLHDMPLVPILVSISYRLLGVSEASSRVVIILFSLGSILIVYLLANKLYDRNVALFAAFFYALSPTNIYWGRLVIYSQIVSFFSLLTILCYYNWIRSNSRKQFVFMLVSFFLGTISDWAAFYLAGILPIHYILTDNRSRSKILALPLLAFIIFGIFLLHIYLLKGGYAFSDLVDAFRRRTNVAEFTTLSLLLEELARAKSLFTIPMIILSSFWLFAMLVSAKKILERRKEATNNLLLLSTFIWALTQVILFRNAAWYLDYWLYNLIAPISIASGYTLVTLGKGLNKHIVSIKYISFSLYLAFALGFLLDGLPEIRKLQALAPYKFQYEFGKELKKQVQEGTDILTNLDSKGSHVVGYYAERYVEYAVTTNRELQSDLENPSKNYGVFVFSDQAYKDDEMIVYLENHSYQKFEKTIEDHRLKFFTMMKTNQPE